MSEQYFRLLLRSSDLIDKVPSNVGIIREGDDLAGGQPGSELAAVHLVQAKLDGNPELKDSSAGLYFKVGTTLGPDSNDKIVRIGPTYVTTDGVRPDQRELNNTDVDYTGALWFRGDAKILYINYTGEHNEEAWELITTNYTNDTPTPYSFGGIPEGSTFDRTTFEELVTQLLYPEVIINRANLLITPDPIGVSNKNFNVEIGEEIGTPGGANLRTLSITPGPYHKITGVSYLGGTNPEQLLIAENAFVDGGYVGFGVNRIFTYTQSAVMVYNVPTTFYWGSRLTLSSGKVLDGPQRTINWKYRSFVAYTDQPNLITVDNPGGISLLDRVAEWEKPESEDPTYLYVFLPIGRVVADQLIEDGYDPYSLVRLKDSYGIAMSLLSDVDVIRNGVTVRYQRYRTTYKTAYPVHLIFE
jgi:hypothetical protein